MDSTRYVYELAHQEADGLAILGVWASLEGAQAEARRIMGRTFAWVECIATKDDSQLWWYADDDGPTGFYITRYEVRL